MNRIYEAIENLLDNKTDKQNRKAALENQGKNWLPKIS